MISVRCAHDAAQFVAHTVEVLGDLQVRDQNRWLFDAESRHDFYPLVHFSHELEELPQLDRRLSWPLCWFATEAAILEAAHHLVERLLELEADP